MRFTAKVEKVQLKGVDNRYIKQENEKALSLKISYSVSYVNMDFNVKKIVKDAGAALSRVVQVSIVGITFYSNITNQINSTQKKNSAHQRRPS